MINAFFTYYLNLGRSTRTAEEYKKEIDLYVDYLSKIYPGLNQEELILLTDKHDAYAYLTYCLEKGNSAATRARKISALRQFYRFLVSRDITDNNPFYHLDRPKVPRSLPVFLSLDDTKKLITSSRSHKDLFYRRRNACIVILFVNTGMRLSELASLFINDIYDDTVILQGKGGKERYVYLNKACQRAIRMWVGKRGHDHGALFVSKSGHPLKPASIAGVVKDELRKVGLGHLSTHKLRHTCATLLYRYGQVDIRLLRDILGHVSIAATQIYTHVVDEQLIRALESHPLSDY